MGICLLSTELSTDHLELIIIHQLNGCVLDLIWNLMRADEPQMEARRRATDWPAFYTVILYFSKNGLAVQERLTFYDLLLR